MKRKISLMLSLFLLISFTILPINAVAASEQDDIDRPSSEDTSSSMPNTDPNISMLTQAAGNGYYEYSIETDEELFVPVSEYAPMARSGAAPTPASNIGPEQPLPLQPRGVIGADNRFKVSSPTSDGRYANTCLLNVTWPNGKSSYGTRFVIKANFVATAGHMVYSANNGGWAKSIAVYGASSGGSYSKYTYATTMKSGGDFVAAGTNYSKAMHDDWGVIVCKDNLNIGNLGRYPANAIGDVSSYTFQTNGYPGDLNSGISWNKVWMYSAYGNLTRQLTTPRYLPTVGMNIDFVGGQSGSPIYRYINGYGYCAQAIGVAQSSGENYAILINNYLQNLFGNL